MECNPGIWLVYGEINCNIYACIVGVNAAKRVNLEKLTKTSDEWERMLLSFGRYETEKEFITDPASFLNFARREWLRHVKESFD